MNWLPDETIIVTTGASVPFCPLAGRPVSTPSICQHPFSPMATTGERPASPCAGTPVSAPSINQWPSPPMETYGVFPFVSVSVRPEVKWRI